MSSNKMIGVTEDIATITMSNEERMTERIAESKAKTDFYKKYPHAPTLLKHSILLECFMELLDPSTTPEKALQSLSSPYFLSGDYSTDHLANIMEYNQSIEVVIFLAYTRFLVTRLPEAFVDGVWEDMLCKTVRYSRKFSDNETEVIHFGSQDDSDIFVARIFNTIIPTEGLRVGTWLDEALSSPSKCTNPYIRLELFRLIRLFRVFHRMTRESLCITFIHTICEIQPHHLYPSGSIDDGLFSIKDMHYVFSICRDREYLQKIISMDLIKQLKEKKQVTDNSNESKFISNCVKIVGVFASMAGSMSISSPDREIKYLILKYCCVVFREDIGSLVNCGDYLPKMTIWMQFRYIIMRPPFRCYVVETIRDLTKAIINYKWGYVKPMLITLRDMIAEDLSVCHMSYTLPRLLLSRQVEGPTLVHQHSLLLRRLRRMHDKNSNENSEFEDNPTSDTIPFPNERIRGDLDRWSLVSRTLPLYDCDSSDSSDDSDCSFLSSSDGSSDSSAYLHESSHRDSFYDDSSDNMDY